MKYRHFLPIVRGSLGAFSGGVTGGVGAIIYSAMGQSDCVVSEVMQVAAVGGGLLYGKFGSDAGMLSYCGFFKTSNPSYNKKIIQSSAYIGLQVLSSLLGCALKHVVDAKPVSENHIAAVLIGATVMIIPWWLMNLNIYNKMDCLLGDLSKLVYKLDWLDEYEESDEEDKLFVPDDEDVPQDCTRLV